MRWAAQPIWSLLADADGTVAVAPLPGDTADAGAPVGSSVPIALYVLGAILVSVGGVILWLLFRPRPALVAGADPSGRPYPSGGGPYPTMPPPDRAPTLGYPRLGPPTPKHGADTEPTTVMPTMRDPFGQPPPVDPWAIQGGGVSDDSTHGFGPRR